MDDLFDRQLRVGLRAMIDQVNGGYPRWATSPAAQRVTTSPRTWWPRAAAGLGWRREVAWLAVAAVLLLLALLGFAAMVGSDPDGRTSVGCPDGSTPDTPGSVGQARPPTSLDQFAGPMVWDTAAARLVLLPGGRTPAWAFDVCTNRWEEMTGQTPTWWRPPGVVVHDDDSHLTVAIADDTVAAYDLRNDAWTDKAPRSSWFVQAAYDPVSGRVLVRDEDDSRLWSYDVETDTWLEVAQGADRPPESGGCGFQFLDYDPAVDRLVLYVEACRPNGPETWLFDPRAGRWSTAEGRTPKVELFIGNDQMVYDGANARSVVYAGGRIAAYDAARDGWDVLFDAGPDEGRLDRVDNALAFDPLNGRLVVIGGGRRVAPDGWRATDDVIAFDVRTRTWIELLAPSGSAIGAPIERN